MKADEVARSRGPEPELTLADDAVSRALARAIPGLTPADSGREWSALGVDSFDLLTLRLAIEKALGGEIADADWIQAATPADLRALAVRLADNGEGLAASRLSIEETIRLGMPQMAAGGLSESWLMKTLGDLHWRLIGKAVGARPSEIRDSLGNRLYPTFTRVRLVASSPLALFEEDEQLRFRAALSRFGPGLFFADISVEGECGRTIEAQLMSSFALRNGDGNRALLRAHPTLPEPCAPPALTAMPPFGLLYHQKRQTRDAAKPILGRCAYEIVPHYDINGVGLLYYAAYPMIADFCQMRFSGSGPRGAVAASIIERDICYFANADIEAALEWRLHRDEAGDGLATEASIVRDDGIVMALITSRKVAV